jgi:hypothetical protein
MEVVKDHSAKETVQPSLVGGIKTAARFAMLAAALGVYGHDATPPRQHARAPDTVGTACDDCDDPANLESGTSLIGRRLLLKREGVRDLVVRVVRRNGALEIDVDGTTYGIQETLGVRAGEKITAIDMDRGDVKIVSAEYGDAIVTRAEIERVLGQLADARSREVTANVDARFTPQPGTVVAASLGVKRWCNGYDGGTEAFGVTFERVEPPTALASRD